MKGMFIVSSIEETSVKKLGNEEVSKVSGGSNVKEEHVYACNTSLKHPMILKKYGMPAPKKPKKDEDIDALLPDSGKAEQ